MRADVTVWLPWTPGMHIKKKNTPKTNLISLCDFLSLRGRIHGSKKEEAEIRDSFAFVLSIPEPAFQTQVFPWLALTFSLKKLLGPSKKKVPIEKSPRSDWPMGIDCLDN